MTEVSRGPLRLAAALAGPFRSLMVQRAGAAYATQVAVAAIAFLTSVVVARELGPQHRGTLAVATTITAIGVQFGTLGLHTSNTFAVARDRSLLPALLGNTFVIATVIGGGGALLAGAILLVLDLSPLPGGLLVLSLAAIPVALCFSLIEHIVLGVQRIGLYNVMELVNRVLILLGVAAIAMASTLTVGEALVAAAAPLLATTIVGIAPLLREGGRPQLSLVLFRQHLRYGFRVYVLTALTYLILRLDVLLVRAELGSTATGNYSVAVSLAEALNLLPIAVGSVIFPRMAAMEDARRRWELGRRAMLLVGLLTGCAGLLLAAVSGRVVLVVYGADYSSAAGPLRWLCLATVAIAMNNILIQYLAAAGAPWWSAAVVGMGVVVNVCLNLVLLDPLGINGAAVASLVAYVLILVASWRIAAASGHKLPRWSPLAHDEEDNLSRPREPAERHARGGPDER